jgi:hypothetical protein
MQRSLAKLKWFSTHFMTDLNKKPAKNIFILILWKIKASCQQGVQYEKIINCRI